MNFVGMGVNPVSEKMMNKEIKDAFDSAATTKTNFRDDLAARQSVKDAAVARGYANSAEYVEALFNKASEVDIGLYAVMKAKF